MLIPTCILTFQLTMTGKFLCHSTVVLALIALVGSSLHDTIDEREYQRMRERNQIIHDTLIEENCPDAEKILGKRALFTPAEAGLMLEVEEKLHGKLFAMLIKCREGKFSATTQTTTVSTTTFQQTTITTLKPTTATTAPQPVECLNAINLTESWRSDNKGGKLNGLHNCDTQYMKNNGRPWFRFTGPAGNQLLNTCPPPYSCGTLAGIWSDAAMPTKIGAVTSITAYASWSNKGCKEFLESVSVVRCSDSVADFVYRHNGSGNCYRGFCGMFAQ